MLICSVFAVPLAIFAIQLAISYHQKADQAQITREGLIYIQKTSLLIQELETFRDLKVITSWSAYPAFEVNYKKSRQQALTQVERLINTTDSPSAKKFLHELKQSIKSDNNAKGMESGSIDAVYEDAQATLDKVHNLAIVLFLSAKITAIFFLLLIY